MRRKKQVDVFNIAFLDLLSGALGAVIILFITVPKNEEPKIAEEKKVVSCTSEKKLIKKCMKQLRESEEENISNKEVITKQKIIITKIQDQLKKTEVKEISESKKETKIQNQSGPDVGFNFKGKNIVFLIDISGSMAGEKIGQVKAGLKMLIASMGSEYRVDIVHFPYNRTENYYALWGQLQPLSTLNVKNEVYQFLTRLRPDGFTPTRAALLYAMTNYPDITDIVLLSDGSPTIPGSRKRDDYLDIIKDVKWNNQHRNVQVNSIGVGEKTFQRSSNLYQFLKKLSQETGGFFYGF